MKDKLKAVALFTVVGACYLLLYAVVLTGILVLGVTVLRWMKVL